MGGWLASLLAYESPERVERLVLVASGGMATRPLATMQAWKAPSEEDIRRSLSGLARAGVDIEPLVKEKVRLAADGDRAARFARVMEHMTNPETRQRYYMARRLPHIKSPTLVLWGSADPVNDLEMGENTHKLIPNSRLSVFEGVGHGVPTERVEEFNQAVEAFLLG
jgi:pimeloyl-ACP methyl ester carboxylesterase